MLADARDTAEAAVPPESAAPAETCPLVGGKVAAPGAEPKKDAEQEASEEIARSDALLAAWGSRRKETGAVAPFALTVQPLMGGADAALAFLNDPPDDPSRGGAAACRSGGTIGA